MDVIKGIILLILNNPMLFILFILCILIEIYYPKIRGFFGEFWVKLELKRLPKDKFIILNDIMIKDDNGTHQIDHLVLSEFGIFVIEMKNYYGLIKGKEFDSKWCQYLGKKKFYFLNPIHQNFGHIKALSKLLELDEKYFISIICFSNQAKLRVQCTTNVTQVDFLIKEILKYKDRFFEIDINKFANILKDNNIVDKNMRKQHVKDIHIKINHNKELENNMICPKCGSELIEKNGKYGKFVGCSNFPKCRYIKK